MQNQWSDEQVLLHLRWANAPLIGEGGEARVFDIAGGRVLRLVRPGGHKGAQQTRAELLQKISTGHTAAAFRAPRVIDIFQVGGRVAVIEERLTGTTLTEALKTAQGQSRDRLICSYLDAAASIGDIEMYMPFWGDIFAPPAFVPPPAGRTSLISCEAFSRSVGLWPNLSWWSPGQCRTARSLPWCTSISSLTTCWLYKLSFQFENCR